MYVFNVLTTKHTQRSGENVKNSSKTNGVNGLELIQIINKKMRLLPLNL